MYLFIFVSCDFWLMCLVNCIVYYLNCWSSHFSKYCLWT